MEVETRQLMLEIAQLQTDYCKEKKVTRLAPYDGLCDRCNNQIYERFTRREAESLVIEYCPFCFQIFRS